MALASTVWDANLYLKFADARMRPALDLMGRLDPANAARPGHAVYDLGCGAGNITRILAERFPGARRADGLYGAQGIASSLYVQDPDGNTVELRSY